MNKPKTVFETRQAALKKIKALRLLIKSLSEKLDLLELAVMRMGNRKDPTK